MHLRVDVSLVAFFSLFEVKQKKTGFFFVGGGWMKDGRKGDEVVALVRTVQRDASDSAERVSDFKAAELFSAFPWVFFWGGVRA